MKAYILKILIENWLKGEWQIQGYSIDLNVSNFCVFLRCKEYVGLMLILYKVYRDDGNKRSINTVKQIMDLAEEFERNGWRVEFVTNLDEAKKKINHYLTLLSVMT